MTPTDIAGKSAARESLAGIGLMLLGVFLYAVNDTMGKWLAGIYSPAQIVLIRSIAALAVLTPLLARWGFRTLLSVQRPGLHLLRALCGTLEVALFYWAVSLMPLADAMTYYLAAPIYVTALSALLLRERVGWRRWLAVIIGFGGVVIALRPSADSLNLGALVAVGGSLCFALLMIATRRLRGTADSVLVTWQISGALVLGGATAPFDWVEPGALHLGALALLGIVSMVATVCVNRSLRLAPPSVVAPYQYTLIVWAMVFGYAVFGDVPKPTTVIGAAVIVGAGLFIFLREQAMARAARPAA